MVVIIVYQPFNLEDHVAAPTDSLSETIDSLNVRTDLWQTWRTFLVSILRCFPYSFLFELSYFLAYSLDLTDYLFFNLCVTSIKNMQPLLMLQMYIVFASAITLKNVTLMFTLLHKIWILRSQQKQQQPDKRILAN